MQQAALMLIGVQLIVGIGLGLLLPVLPYFVQTYGASAVEVTQLVALYALAGMVFSPLLGRLSDAFGRKPLVLCCLAASALTYLAYTCVDSLLAIFALRLASGIAAAKGGVVTAWLIDLVDADERARYLGLFGSMNGIGMLLGPVVASLLFSASGELYQSVFIGGALLSFAACVGVLFVRSPEPALVDAQPTSAATTAGYADLLALNGAVFLAFSVIFSTSAIYMQARFDWGVREAGLAIGLMTGCVALARAFVAHRLLAVLGTDVGTVVTGVAMALLLFLCSLPTAAPAFLLPYCLAAMAYSVAAIGITVLLADRLPVHTRGSGMGHLSASASGAIVFGAATHGYLFDRVSPAAPFQLYGVLVALFIGGWYAHARKYRRFYREQT